MQTLANPAYFSWDQLIVAHTPNHFSAAAACELVIVVIICFFWVFVVLVSVQPCTSPLCLSTSLCLPLYLYAHCPPMYTFPLVGNRSDQVPGQRPSILSHKPDGDMSIRAQRSQYTFAGHVFNSGQSVFTTTHLCFPWTPPPLLKHCIVLKVFETKLNHWILSRFLIRIYYVDQYWLSAIFLTAGHSWFKIPFDNLNVALLTTSALCKSVPLRLNELQMKVGRVVRWLTRVDVPYMKPSTQVQAMSPVYHLRLICRTLSPVGWLWHASVILSLCWGVWDGLMGAFSQCPISPLYRPRPDSVGRNQAIVDTSPWPRGVRSDLLVSTHRSNSNLPIRYFRDRPRIEKSYRFS